VVAGYRDLSNSNWRAMETIPAPYLEGRFWSSKESPTRRLYIVLGEHGVTIRDKSRE